MTTREDDGASGSPDFGKAARSSHHHGKVDFGGTLVIDERTPLSSFKENNISNKNIGNSVIKQTPEGLPRIKTKKIEETQRSEFGWRDFCPGVVSVVVSNSARRFTFTVWVMVIIGGTGNNYGSIIGGFLVWFLWVEAEPFGLLLVEFFTSPLSETNSLRVHLINNAAHMRYVMMGLLLLLVLRFSPKGIFPEGR